MINKVENTRQGFVFFDPTSREFISYSKYTTHTGTHTKFNSSKNLEDATVYVSILEIPYMDRNYMLERCVSYPVKVTTTVEIV